MKTSIKLTLVAALALLVVATSGCGFFYRIKAKNEINDGARAYNNGKYADAARHFQNALELDPDNNQAYLFYAQSLNAQVGSGTSDPKVVEMGEKAIKAFEEALKRDPNNDAIYAFIAFRYGELGKPQVQEEWLLKRASLDGVKKEVKRDVYYNIGVNKWNEAYPITTRWADKTKGPQRVDDPKYGIYLRSDLPAADRKKAEEATKQGLEFIHKSLAIDPEYANGYSYLALLQREQAKLAESDADKTKYLDEWKKAIDRAVELNQKAAEQQAQQQAPPAS